MDLQRQLPGSKRVWRFREAPFSLTSDPKFLFKSAGHTDALEQFERMLARHDSILLITGEPGVGKTLLCREFARRHDARTFIGLVSTAPASREDLLRTVLDGFGLLASAGSIASGAPRFELVKTLRQFFSALEQLDARAIIVVDDAHLMPAECFEELRELSDLDGSAGKLGQTVLVGEPALRDRLASAELQDFAQRVTRRATLRALTPDEVHAYVEHRVRIALWAGEPAESPFTPAALDAVAAASGGVPRVINSICDRALERACSPACRAVDETDIASAARELGIARPAEVRARPRRVFAAAAAAAVLMAAIAGAIWLFGVRGVMRSPARGPRAALPAIAKTAGAQDTDQAIRERAAALSRVPDVRALLKLRDQVAARPPAASDQGGRAELLRAIEADIDAAQRLQLDVDRQHLQQLPDGGVTLP